MEELPFEKKNKQAIIFIGIQASGKTTFYNRLLSGESYTHISLDVLHTRNKERLALMDCLSEEELFCGKEKRWLRKPTVMEQFWNNPSMI